MNTKMMVKAYEGICNRSISTCRWECFIPAGCLPTELPRLPRSKPPKQIHLLLQLPSSAASPYHSCLHPVRSGDAPDAAGPFQIVTSAGRPLKSHTRTGTSVPFILSGTNGPTPISTLLRVRVCPIYPPNPAGPAPRLPPTHTPVRSTVLYFPLAPRCPLSHLLSHSLSSSLLSPQLAHGPGSGEERSRAGARARDLSMLLIKAGRSEGGKPTPHAPPPNV
eukprot:591228-Pelagomonas_calceolata.AAC.7